MKFPTFLHNHPAHRDTYRNVKLIYGCQRYITQHPFQQRAQQPYSTGPLLLRSINHLNHILG